MENNVVYGRFSNTPAGLGARLNSVMEAHDEFARKRHELQPGHWSTRYMAIGDFMSAINTIENLLPHLCDTDFLELERYLTAGMMSFGTSIMNNIKARREANNAVS